MGHVRDLPGDAKEIPAKYKAHEWARLGVNVDDDFEPLYVVPSDKKEVVRELKDALHDVRPAHPRDRRRPRGREHLLAPARGAEAEGAGAADGVPRDHRGGDPGGAGAHARRRRPAGAGAGNAAHPRPAGGLHRVAAAVEEDRVGPLRRPGAVRGGAPARRARARAPRLPCRHLLGPGGASCGMPGRDSRRSSAWSAGRRSPPGATSTNPPASSSRAATWCCWTRRRPVRSAPACSSRSGPSPAPRKSRASAGPGRRSPPARCSRKPTASSGSRRRDTMRVAQSLYEHGFITYMRTDSVHLSDQAIEAARNAVHGLYGKEYLPAEPRRYPNKSANAQEAHEAIRPAGAFFKLPSEAGLDGRELALYDLIWKRTVASQMADARQTGIAVTIEAADAIFRASGKRIDFPGFLRAYVEGSDDPEAALEDQEIILPPLKEGDTPDLRGTRGAVARDPAAGALHRSDAGQGARGRRRRPPQHLCERHRHDPRARLCAAAGPGTGADIHGVRGNGPARGALPAPGGREVHRADGGDARRDLGGARRVAAVPARVLPRRRGPQAAGAAAREADRSDRRAHGGARGPRCDRQDREVRALRGSDARWREREGLHSEGCRSRRPLARAGREHPAAEDRRPRRAWAGTRKPASRSSC